ncbi:MAG: hypothetical protein AAGJ11_14705, partial [Bacteroidota bacterium]
MREILRLAEPVLSAAEVLAQDDTVSEAWCPYADQYLIRSAMYLRYDDLIAESPDDLRRIERRHRASPV